MKPALRVLLYQFRTTEHARERELASFRRSSGLGPKDIVAVDAMQVAPDIDHLRHATGVILGGSPLSVGEVPFRDALASTLKTARLTGYPMLGVCFGAQLMADLWGGQVRHDPERKEFGTFQVELLERGVRESLFAGLPRAFDAQCAHHDRIEVLPSGAVLLAKSERCPVQAFGFPGFDVYGVQFHPERSKADYEERLTWKLDNTQEDPAEIEAIRARLRETPLAETIVSNFVRRHVHPFRPFV